MFNCVKILQNFVASFTLDFSYEFLSKNYSVFKGKI